MTDTERTALDTEVKQLRSELEIYKQKLIEAHQMTAVGELLAGIVHEINTPIGSILSNNQVSAKSLQILEQLLEESQQSATPLPPKVSRILKTLMSLAAVDKIACERIITVVRGLKTFVGGKGNEFLKADLNQILDNTLKLAHCEFRRRITVKTDFGEIPEIECEPHQLGQVFLNMLVNAGHAIDGEGEVTVETRLEDSHVHIAIGDNGSGIAPQHQASIFSTGFTTKAAGVGTGLGLSISKDIIVDVHGGSIEFESELGKGTTFHIRIPVSRDAGAKQ